MVPTDSPGPYIDFLQHFTFQLSSWLYEKSVPANYGFWWPLCAPVAAYLRETGLTDFYHWKCCITAVLAFLDPIRHCFSHWLSLSLTCYSSSRLPVSWWDTTLFITSCYFQFFPYQASPSTKANFCSVFSPPMSMRYFSLSMGSCSLHAILSSLQLVGMWSFLAYWMSRLYLLHLCKWEDKNLTILS